LGLANIFGVKLAGGGCRSVLLEGVEEGGAEGDGTGLFFFPELGQEVGLLHL
jgi:hypothetical protein